MRAETIAKALGGQKAGGGWTARCPAHDDRIPSLSIRDADDNKVLVRCHAGCDQGRVIAALRSRGLWDRNGRKADSFTCSQRRQATSDPADHDRANRTAAALRIWRAAVPAAGTPVEAYLRSRGIVMPVPARIGFHIGMKHPSGGVLPAMVALVTRGADDVPLAIHRSFLSRFDTGKAPDFPQRMMFGPCRGGAVRLADPADVLMVGEGIETCLAAMQATGLPAWAALSTSGLRTLDLPADVKDVIILADGDDPGEAAARDCALRWREQGRRVRIARPPRGMDFNDMLMGGSPSIEEGAR